MHIRSLASLAFVAFAAQAFAQQQPKVFKRSITTGRDLGFMRRADGGYQPEDEVCSRGGNTCAEACGSGYQQCKSTDQAVHCYNPAVGETCCSTTTGNSCLSAFYCTHDPTSETFCCPNGMNLGDCAVKHGVTGALTSDPPVPASTSTSTSQAPPTSTSVAPTTTSTSTTSTSIVVVVSTTASPSSTEAPSTTIVTSTVFTPSAGLTSAFSAVNSTLATTSTRSPSTRINSAAPGATTAPAADENAAGSQGPASLAVILGAAFVAALL
ncbi:PRP 4 C domain-containing protein [Colletotrichum plurivorum]|uniref:PRP 4 C domain-containing protein n=1 Tax=Colletotrichum plurivorum TaxID=2175906 RepID=A0A8H6NR35_9PEZI|nr:PRP 4 C domain-containing protein [Colletotrichum plurivorum]